MVAGVKDAEFMKAADPFWNATSASPAFQSVEASLMIAFQDWPKLKLPPACSSKSKRILQPRTYESPSNGYHVRMTNIDNLVFNPLSCSQI